MVTLIRSSIDSSSSFPFLPLSLFSSLPPPLSPSLSLPPSLFPSLPQLCQVCRLHPEALLGYMTLLEGEWQKCGRLRLVDARRLLKIDVNKTRKIFNFLTSKGHIH